MISDAEAEINLRDRLFYVLLKTLKDNVGYLYDNPSVTYTQLLVAARKAEAEVGDGKSGTVTVNTKADTADNELASLKE